MFTFIEKYDVQETRRIERERGRVEGRVEGWQEGIAIGEERGIAIGEERGRVVITHQITEMLSKGVPSEEIIKALLSENK